MCKWMTGDGEFRNFASCWPQINSSARHGKQCVVRNTDSRQILPISRPGRDAVALILVRESKQQLERNGLLAWTL